jgi:hypothetical protein
MVQGVIYTLAALLAIGAVIAALGYSQDLIGILWAVQLAGLAAILALLALCAVAPDRPVTLKSRKR